MASIKQLGERKFKITVCNGYRPDGKKISRAKTIDVPKDVRASAIQQFVAHEAEEMERFVKNGFSEYAGMTFASYAERWLSRQVKYAPGTLAGYRQLLRTIYPIIGGIRLDRIRPITLENMLDELRKRTVRGRRIKEDTVQKYLTAASVVLSDAKRNGVLTFNPAHMVQLPPVKKAEQFIPTDEQIRLLLEMLVQDEPHFFLFYLLAVVTGCRRGELSALKWTDFSRGREDDPVMLTVSRSRRAVTGMGMVEGSTKNHRSRTIYLDAMTEKNLAYYYLAKSYEATKEHRPMPEYLFTDRHGELIHPDTFTKHLKKLYSRLGFPGSFHLHTLRHYFVTTLLHQGVDKQTVAELAGHGDTSFLERTYCHPEDKHKEQAARVMAGMLYPGRLTAEGDINFSNADEELALPERITA